MEHSRLRKRCPEPVTWPTAVPVTRAVESDHALVPGKPVYKAAGNKISVRDGIAMQQHHGRAVAAHQVVKANAVNIDEFACRQVFTFGLARLNFDSNGSGADSDGSRQQTNT